MFNGWMEGLLAGLQTINEILTAGIAITAFSLFLYALSFNLRDRVARSFAIILLCVVGDEIPTKHEDRPIIGIVGEFYTCMNSWANNDIIREFESLGAETRLGPTTTDYVVYFNEVYPETHFSRGEYLAAPYYYLRRFPFMHWRGKIEGMMKDGPGDCSIPRVEDMIKLAAPYVSDYIDPVVTVNVAKAKNYAIQGCSGIANLIILNCLFGTLSTAIYRGIQTEHNRIPVLNMIYDGLKQTNAKTRIAAFVHQAKLYHERCSIA